MIVEEWNNVDSFLNKRKGEGGKGGYLGCWGGYLFLFSGERMFFEDRRGIIICFFTRIFLLFRDQQTRIVIEFII